MADSAMYHDGSRQLQDTFATRRLADRLAEVVAHGAFTDADRAFIESRPLFFLATADGRGGRTAPTRADSRIRPRRRCADARVSQLRRQRHVQELGEHPRQSHVGLLFIDFESPRRLRVNGRAAVREDDPLLAEFVGAQLVVRVQADAIFPNCPRYIHKMQVLEESPYVPREGRTPPVPEWKRRPVFREVLAPGDPAVGIAREETRDGAHDSGLSPRLMASSYATVVIARFR